MATYLEDIVFALQGIGLASEHNGYIRKGRNQVTVNHILRRENKEKIFNEHYIYSFNGGYVSWKTEIFQSPFYIQK